MVIGRGLPPCPGKSSLRKDLLLSWELSRQQRMIHERLQFGRCVRAIG